MSKNIFGQKNISNNSDYITLVGKVDFKIKNINFVNFILVENTKIENTEYTLILLQRGGYNILEEKGNIIKNIFINEIYSQLKSRSITNEQGDFVFIIEFSDKELRHLNQIRIFSIIIKTITRIENEADCFIKIEQYNKKS